MKKPFRPWSAEEQSALVQLTSAYRKPGGGTDWKAAQTNNPTAWAIVTAQGRRSQSAVMTHYFEMGGGRNAKGKNKLKYKKRRTPTPAEVPAAVSDNCFPHFCYNCGAPQRPVTLALRTINKLTK